MSRSIAKNRQILVSLTLIALLPTSLLMAATKPKQQRASPAGRTLTLKKGSSRHRDASNAKRLSRAATNTQTTNLLRAICLAEQRNWAHEARKREVTNRVISAFERGNNVEDKVRGKIQESKKQRREREAREREDTRKMIETHQENDNVRGKVLRTIQQAQKDRRKRSLAEVMALESKELPPKVWLIPLDSPQSSPSKDGKQKLAKGHEYVLLPPSSSSEDREKKREKEKSK